MIVVAAGAFAQDEACPGKLAVAEVSEVLQAVQGALGSLDGDRASSLLEEVHGLARCLGEVVPPEVLGTYAANRSVVSFYEQDFEEARRWALLAVATTGMATAGSVVGPERWWVDYGGVTPEVGAVDGGPAPPAGGLLVVDGRALTAPAAAVATPHLLQVLDRKGRVVTTRWIDGTAFPADVLTGGALGDPPRWWTEPPGMSVVTVSPTAPPPTPTVGEVVFDGVVATDGCPFAPNPTDVQVRNHHLTIEGQRYPLRADLDIVAVRDVLRTCGELRAARRFSKWAVTHSALRPRRELREAFVEALSTPEPVRKKKHPAGE